MVFDSRQERARSAQPPSTDMLSDYAREAAGAINAYLQAKGERHVVADVLVFDAAASGLEDSLAAVRFRMRAGAPGDLAPVHVVPATRDGGLGGLLGNLTKGATLPYLNERRQLRIYGSDDITFIKPRERRYWSRTAGLNDADVILADHWIVSSDVHARG
jgi:hypothetical protein